MIRIGIDPAFRSNGFCICIIDDTEVRFITFKNGYLDFCSWLISDRPTEGKITVIVENSNLQNVTFAKLPPMPKSYNEYVKAMGIRDRINRNVGQNQTASQYTVDICKSYFGAANVHGISPKEKGAKVTNDKIFAAIVKCNGHQITQKNISQDARDAYMLAVHRLPLNIKKPLI